MERYAIELAKLTPACGWGSLADPATVKLTEPAACMSRAYRELVEDPLPRMKLAPGDDISPQGWVDRYGAMGGRPLELLHTVRTAYLNLQKKGQ